MVRKETIMSETLPKLHSVVAAADYLGVSVKKMWRLINSHQISFIKINRRALIQRFENTVTRVS